MANKADAVNKAIDSFIAKVKYIKFKAKVDDADIEKLTDDRKKLIGDESQLLEDHRKANKEILTRHFYDILKSATIIQYTIKGRFMSR